MQLPSSKPTKPAMSISARLMLAAAGLVLVGISVDYMRRGIFTFTNGSYHQTMFSAGGIGTGIFMVLLAFLPSGNWVYRSITTRRETKLTHHTRHSQVHKTQD